MGAGKNHGAEGFGAVPGIPVAWALHCPSTCPSVAQRGGDALQEHVAECIKYLKSDRTAPLASPIHLAWRPRAQGTWHGDAGCTAWCLREPISS